MAERCPQEAGEGLVGLVGGRTGRKIGQRTAVAGYPLFAALDGPCERLSLLVRREVGDEHVRRVVEGPRVEALRVLRYGRQQERRDRFL
jgi:hypothetical protein